jgi:hypothetical protein
MSIERRHPRQPGPFEGAWGGSPGDRSCRITGLNPGGCFVDSPVAPKAGEAIMVSVLFGDTRFTLPAEVVYVDRVQGFGVRFPPSDQARALAYAMGVTMPGGHVG